MVYLVENFLWDDLLTQIPSFQGLGCSGEKKYIGQIEYTKGRVKQQFNAAQIPRIRLMYFRNSSLMIVRKNPLNNDDQTDKETLVKKARFGAEMDDESQKTIVYGKNGFG